MVAGDFLASVPAADLYLLGRILHDFSDSDCVVILTTVAALSRLAAASSSWNVSLNQTPHRAVWPSLIWTLFGAKDCTAAEYELLMTAAGLHVVRVQTVKSARGPWLIIEARAT